MLISAIPGAIAKYDDFSLLFSSSVVGLAMVLV